MKDQEIEAWLNSVLPRQGTLTNSVRGILENLLRSQNIDFLAVSGRTKTVQSSKDKINRKHYAKPKEQLTDISGVRAIFYLESDVQKASKIVEESFAVDKENSLNRDALLSVDQIGYRSVHYVCELGKQRAGLPEYEQLVGLKFELQLRTVLQHAWAELSHDRNYKFSDKLPRKMERELFLYAGMLEIADKGFDAVAAGIDAYAKEIRARAASGDLDIAIDSVSLEQFVASWAKREKFVLGHSFDKDASRVLVEELAEYGINRIAELNEIIPSKYASAAKASGYSTNLLGVGRDWMILNDYKRYRDRAWHRKWRGFDDEEGGASFKFFVKVVGVDAAQQIVRVFESE